MPNKLTAYCWLVFSLCLFFDSRAQIKNSYPEYQFTNYSVDHGLAHNFIMSIYQDNDGFMWFGSLNGMNRFDGKAFKYFERNENDSNAIKGDFVNFIYEDSKSITWVGTENGGLHLFDKEKETFQLIYDRDSSQHKVKFFANSITEDHEGNLWIATFQGLKKYIRENQSYVTYRHQAGNPNTLCNNNIFKVYCDSKNQIWIGTRNGLDILSADRKSFKHIPLKGNRITDYEVIEFLEDENGVMWIGTFSNGLIKYDTFTHSQEVILMDSNDDYSNTARKLLKDDSGNIWIGGRNGLFIYDPVNRTFKHFPQDNSFSYGIAHNSILELYKDRFGDIWLGTRYGVSHWNKQKQVFNYYHSENDDKRCLNSSSVFNFCELDQNLYIATESGGINILQKDGSFQYLKKPLLNTNNIKSICKDEEGNLWIGTFMGGINVYNPKNHKVRYYLKNSTINPKCNINDDRVNVIVKDFRNTLWIGTGAGLSCYDKKKDCFKSYGHITTRQINWIKEDDDRSLWFATADSLFKMNILSDSLVLTKNMGVVTRTIYKDKKDQYWLTTVGKGVIVFKDSIKSTITAKNGLSSDLTFGIVEDNNGYLWISSANGLNMLNPETNEIKTYFKNDGTRINQYNYNSFAKLSSGELVFGGNNGFVKFNPVELQHLKTSPKIQITDFSIFGNTLKLTNDSSSLLNKSIIYTDTIELDHTQNFFSIHYAVLNYQNPERNQYKYKLEGVDKDWVNAGNKNVASYTKVSPGIYTFKVKGSDGYNWNHDGDQIVIIIKPPFYQTKWFISLSILITIALILLFIRWRNRANEQQRLKLQKLVEEKTRYLELSKNEIIEQKEEIQAQNDQLVKLSNQVKEQYVKLEHQANALEEKVRVRTKQLEKEKVRAEESDRLKSVFLANMSHEIRTPMNGILGFTDLLKDHEIEKDEARKYIDIIEESGKRMLNIINGLIDISKIESNQIDIKYEKANLDEILNYIYQFFKPDAEKKHLNFVKKVVAQNIEINYQTDVTKMIQILSNLVENAIKFTKDGFVEVGYRLEGGFVEWYVTDSGIGIKSCIQETIFDRFTQGDSSTTKCYEGAGIGLYITKQFVEKMNGTISFKSIQGKGTTFMVKFAAETK